LSRLWLIGADCARSAPLTENLEASPTLEVCGVRKMPNDEWIRTFADGRNVKFSHDELMDVRSGVKEHHSCRFDEQRPHRRGRGEKLYRSFYMR